MAGFVYFLPNETALDLGVPAKWLKAREKHGLAETLGDIRDPKHLERRDVTSGPGGQPGCVICCLRSDGENPGAIGYFKDRQTWAPTFGSAWIGYESLPSPAWLLRVGDSRSGLPTHDSFDRRWLIPVARRPNTNGKEPGESLPTQTTFDANRKPVKSVRADAVRLWEASGRVWDTFNGETDDPLSDDELQWIALQSLAWHYRIGPDEVNAFAAGGQPVIDSDTAQRFFLSLIHWEILSAKGGQKGNDEAPTGSDSSTGSTDETPTGDQVGAN